MRESARAGRLQGGGLQQRRLVVVWKAVAGVLARVLARLAQRLESTQRCWAYRLLLLCRAGADASSQQPPLCVPDACLQPAEQRQSSHSLATACQCWTCTAAGRLKDPGAQTQTRVSLRPHTALLSEARLSARWRVRLAVASRRRVDGVVLRHQDDVVEQRHKPQAKLHGVACDQGHVAHDQRLRACSPCCNAAACLGQDYLARPITI